ncbi:MAG: hypothetical protein AAFZ87_06465 [Planctomycetota bacterium]
MAAALTGGEKGLALVVVVLNVALALVLAQRASFPGPGDPDPGTAELDAPMAAHAGETSDPLEGAARAPRLADAGDPAAR